MKLSNNSYFLLAVMLAMLVIVFSAFGMKFYASKLLPLTLGGAVFIMSFILLVQEIRATRTHVAREVQQQENPRVAPSAGEWRKYLPVSIWVLSFFLLIWLAGYLVAVPVFLFSYTRYHGTKWLNSLLIAVITVIIVYGLFELGLDIQLYQGLVFQQ